MCESWKQNRNWRINSKYESPLRTFEASDYSQLLLGALNARFVCISVTDACHFQWAGPCSFFTCFYFVVFLFFFIFCFYQILELLLILWRFFKIRKLLSILFVNFSFSNPWSFSQIHVPFPNFMNVLKIRNCFSYLLWSFFSSNPWTPFQNQWTFSQNWSNSWTLFPKSMIFLQKFELFSPKWMNFFQIRGSFLKIYELFQNLNLFTFFGNFCFASLWPFYKSNFFLKCFRSIFPKRSKRSMVDRWSADKSMVDWSTIDRLNKKVFFLCWARPN